MGRITGVQNIAAAVDSFDVPVACPHGPHAVERRAAYYRHDKGPALKATACTDACGRMVWLRVGCGYASSDRTELLLSSLGDAVTCEESLDSFLPSPYVLIADSAYSPGSRRLLVAFSGKSAELSSTEQVPRQVFNHLLHAARSVVERSISMLRRAFAMGRPASGTRGPGAGVAPIPPPSEGRCSDWG